MSSDFKVPSAGESLLSRNTNQELVARVLARDNTVRLAVSNTMLAAGVDMDALPMSRLSDRPSTGDTYVAQQQSIAYAATLAPHVEAHNPPTSVEERYVNQLLEDLPEHSEQATPESIIDLSADTEPFTNTNYVETVTADVRNEGENPISGVTEGASQSSGTVNIDSLSRAAAMQAVPAAVPQYIASNRDEVILAA